VVPPGVRHRLSNGGPEPCVVRVVVRPALYFEELLEVIYGLARDGLDDESGPKSLLQLAAPLEVSPHVLEPTWRFLQFTSSL
jgi:hypothetical protein